MLPVRKVRKGQGALSRIGYRRQLTTRVVREGSLIAVPVRFHHKLAGRVKAQLRLIGSGEVEDAAGELERCEDAGWCLVAELAGDWSESHAAAVFLVNRDVATDISGEKCIVVVRPTESHRSVLSCRERVIRSRKRQRNSAARNSQVHKGVVEVAGVVVDRVLR